MPGSIPGVFWRLARYWHLPHALTRQWWQALSTSCYSQPRALRQAWLLWDAAPLADPASLVHTTGAPAEVIAALEALVHEGRMSRRRATQTEECVLRRVTAAGTWQ